MSSIRVENVTDESLWGSIIRDLNDFIGELVLSGYDCNTSQDFSIEFSDSISLPMGIIHNKIIVSVDFSHSILFITKRIQEIYSREIARTGVEELPRILKSIRENVLQTVQRGINNPKESWLEIESEWQGGVPVDNLQLVLGVFLPTILHEIAHSTAQDFGPESEMRCDRTAAAELLRMVDVAKSRKDSGSEHKLILGAFISHLIIAFYEPNKTDSHPHPKDRIAEVAAIFKPKCDDDLFALAFVFFAINYNVDIGSIIESETSYYDGLMRVIDRIQE